MILKHGFPCRRWYTDWRVKVGCSTGKASDILTSIQEGEENNFYFCHYSTVIYSVIWVRNRELRKRMPKIWTPPYHTPAQLCPWYWGRQPCIPSSGHSSELWPLTSPGGAGGQREHSLWGRTCLRPTEGVGGHQSHPVSCQTSNKNCKARYIKSNKLMRDLPLHSWRQEQRWKRSRSCRSWKYDYQCSTIRSRIVLWYQTSHYIATITVNVHTSVKKAGMTVQSSDKGTKNLVIMPVPRCIHNIHIHTRITLVSWSILTPSDGGEQCTSISPYSLLSSRVLSSKDTRCWPATNRLWCSLYSLRSSSTKLDRQCSSPRDQFDRDYGQEHYILGVLLWKQRS